MLVNAVKDLIMEPTTTSQTETAQGEGTKRYCKGTLFSGLQNPIAETVQRAVMEKINSKREMSSSELGHKLKFKWCSEAGPRIGYISEYPLDVRLKALEISKCLTKSTKLMKIQMV